MPLSPPATALGARARARVRPGSGAGAPAAAPRSIPPAASPELAGAGGLGHDYEFLDHDRHLVTS
ncbi:MAG: hypothetical protein M0C28_32785 [Candidatus Moduliflexus flocculans]|nr:hypothetical protein [Candidatus Moduliflexus flocculans]